MSEAPATALPWDSAHFGVAIARVNAHRADATSLATVEAWASDNDTRCLYMLVDDHPPTLAALARDGWTLVDTRITLDRHVTPGPDQPPPLRLATPADLDALAPLARISHTDSRFYADPRFDRTRCDDLYETWIARSLNGWADRVWTVTPDDIARAYLTAHLRDDGARAEIGLVSVHPDHRGQRFGNRLIEQAIAWAATQGAARISVVTQCRNIAAQRLYQAAGFRTASAQLWFHRWR